MYTTISDEYLPADTFIFSTYRHPWSVLLSAMNYHGWFHNTEKFKLKPLETFFKKASNQTKQLVTVKSIVYLFPHLNTKFSTRDSFLKVLEQDLHRLLDKMPLIFITEYFDESLLLLKRIMCWDMKDIIYTRLKTGTYKNYLYENMTHYKHLYFKENEADFALYDLYNQTFWSLIRGLDSDFNKEMEVFKSINQKVETFCEPMHDKLRHSYSLIWDVMQENRTLTVKETDWNDSFQVTVEDCVLMAINEEVLRNILLAKQYPEVSTRSFCPVG